MIKQHRASNTPSSCWENRIFVSFAYQKFNYFAPIEIDDPFEHMICTGNDGCFFSTMKGKVYKIENSNWIKNTTKIEEIAYCEEFKQDKSRIKFLVAGYHFVFVVKESKNIYAFNSNSSGYRTDEIGTVISKNSVTDHLVQIKTDHFIGEKSEITHAVCGSNSLLIVLDNKELYVSGRLRGILKDFTRKTIDIHEPLIETISVGYDHMIVKTVDGNFYCCGENKYGQLFSCSGTNSFIKLEMEQVLNLKALRLSYLTCKVTPNRLDVYGYLGSTPTADYKIEKDHHYSQTLNGYTNDIEPYGGYSTVIICNNRKKQLMALGSTSNASSKPYNILDKIKTDHSDLAEYIDNHEVRYAHCGFSVIGFMMGSSQQPSLLLTNLHKIRLYSVKEVVHSSGVVPCSDIIIKC